jgi:hypothetical protein
MAKRAIKKAQASRPSAGANCGCGCGSVAKK